MVQADAIHQISTVATMHVHECEMSLEIIVCFYAHLQLNKCLNIVAEVHFTFSILQ